MAVVMALLLALGGAYGETAPSGVPTYEAAFFADARPNTAYDMIARLPGFSFDDGTTARGFAGTAGNVLIDGQRPTSKTDDLQSILLRIPASDVDRIEVIRGGAPGIDMQGQTVVANVVRKKGNSTRIVTDVEDNIFLDGHTVPNASLQFTRHAGDSTYEASLTRYGNFDDSVGNGFHTLTDVATGAVTRDRAHTTGMGTGGALTGAATIPLLKGTFKANLTLQDNPFYSTATYFGQAGTRYLIDNAGSSNAELGLHWRGNLGPSLELESLFLQRLGHQSDLNSSDQPGLDQLFSSVSDTAESILRHTVRYHATSALTLETGLEGAYNYLDGTTGFLMNGVSVPLPDAKAHVDEKRGEAFLQGTWKIASDWLLEAGSRFETSTISEKSDTVQSRSFFYPKPRAVLTWSPDKDTQVRLRYERVVGQLDFNNFVATGSLGTTGVTAGNSDLRPDQRTQYAVSYERHFWDKGALVATLMHEEITDVVDLVPVHGPSGVFDAPGNIGNGQNNEIDLVLTLPLDRLGIPNGLITSTNTWSLSSVPDPVTGAHRVISGERPQNFQLNFTQDIDRLKSTWGITYYNCWDEYYYRLAQTQHRRVLPPYVSAFWEYKPTPSWSLHFELINLGRFIYKNEFFDYAGPRNTSPLVQIEDRSIMSQPRLYIQIRKTFD
jgi:hypothetical protein